MPKDLGESAYERAGRMKIRWKEMIPSLELSDRETTNVKTAP